MINDIINEGNNGDFTAKQISENSEISSYWIYSNDKRIDLTLQKVDLETVKRVLRLMNYSYNLGRRHVIDLYNHKKQMKKLC